MSTTQPHDVYLVGTIPLTHSLDVFTAVAHLLGSRVKRVPDGEVGDRQMWINAQYPILAACPGLEVGDIPPEGLTRRTSYRIPVRVRSTASVGDFVFGELGYARYATSSYGQFRSLKKAGKIPTSWRFQVNLPCPLDVLSMVEPGSRALIEAPYERALLSEAARIQDAIPHAELAITWDVVRGLLFWEDPTSEYFTMWFDDPKNGIVDRLARLGKAVLPGVELGYHLCYGSQDNKHALEPRDLGASVDLANAIARQLPRPINYVHMQVPRDRNDDAYFAALERLDRARVQHVYLGLLHESEGIAGARLKIEAAERVLADFGIATECGMGRLPHPDVSRLLKLHADVIG